MREHDGRGGRGDALECVRVWACVHTRARVCTRVRGRVRARVGGRAHVCTRVHARARRCGSVGGRCAHACTRVPRGHAITHKRPQTCTQAHHCPGMHAHTCAHTCTRVHALASERFHVYLRVFRLALTSPGLCTHACTRVHPGARTPTGEGGEGERGRGQG